MNELDIDTLAQLFGTTSAEINEFCKDELKDFNGRFDRLTPERKEQAIIESIDHLVSGFTKKSGPDRLPDWERGWTENLNKFKNDCSDLDDLVPGYVRPGQVMRLNGDYAIFEDPKIEKQYIALFRSWLSKKYFTDCDSIYEFGCGSCTHVAFLAKIFPQKKIYGLDWANASVEICEILKEQYHSKIKGHLFNFFAPDKTFKLDECSAVLTFGALEQCSDQFTDFIEYLCAQQPKICVHVEGLDELYDKTQLFDYLAFQYNKKRNYLTGFLSHLEELEKAKKVKILKSHRHHFGSRHNDTLSYIIWKPNCEI